VYALSSLRLRGGSTREVELRMVVDGVEAPVGHDSWWQRDVRLSYFSDEQISLGQIDVFFLIGHDGFKLLALIAMPVPAHNLTLPPLRSGCRCSRCTLSIHKARVTNAQAIICIPPSPLPHTYRCSR
jgi:hypothetical protein